MKAGLFTIAALTASAYAQPHRHGHLHPRDGAVVTVNAPDVIVYVDQNGNPLPVPEVNTPAPPPAYEASAPVAPPVYNAPKTPTKSPKKTPPKKTKPKKGTKPQDGPSLSYSPYNADGTCKTQDQVKDDFTKINGFSMIRIYGTDCNQVTTVKNVACPKGMKLFAGIFDITNVQAEAAILIAAVNGDWSCINTVSVGNEVVNSGKATVEAVVSAVNSARVILRAAGYTGPVVAVDTFIAVIAHPEICLASDYAAVNIHAFFDGNVPAEQAGQFVWEQAKRVTDACGGKKTFVTESGWPSLGDPNNVAIPSKQNQKIAIDSITKIFSNDITIFTAFDDLWKTNFAGSHNAECHWGIL